MRRDGNGRNVTFPARTFTVHGERRGFALLRAVADPSAQDRVRELVLDLNATHVSRYQQHRLKEKAAR